MKKTNFAKRIMLVFVCAFIAVCALFVGSLDWNKESDNAYALNNYQVTINVNDTAMGNYTAVALDSAGNKINFVSGNSYVAGTKITFTAQPSQYHEFSYFDINGTKVYSTCHTVTVENQDIEVSAVFATKKFAVDVSVKDSELNSLGNKPFTMVIERASGVSSDSPVQKYVKIGDKIKSIALDSSLISENYRFDGWFIQGTDQIPVEFNLGTDGLTITQEFIDNYYRDGKITIYCKFTQMCTLKIFVPTEYSANVNYILCIGEGLEYHDVDELQARYPYGTKFQISAESKSDDYEFKGFGGVAPYEEYLAGSDTLCFEMKDDRTISLDFAPRQLQLNVNLSKVDGGKLEISSEKVAIGDTVVLSYDLPSSRKIASMKINGKSAKEFADELNRISESEKDVAYFNADGVLSFYVDKDVYHYLKTENSLICEATSSVNGIYITIVVVYILLAVAFGALIITFTILYNNTQKKLFELNKKQAEAIKRKQEQYAKEKEEQNRIEQEALQVKDEVVKKPAARKTATGKRKTSTAKKPAAKKATETKKQAGTKAGTKKTSTNSSAKSSSTKAKSSTAKKKTTKTQAKEGK